MIGANDSCPSSFFSCGKDLVDLVGFESTTSSLSFPYAKYIVRNSQRGPVARRVDIHIVR